MKKQIIVCDKCKKQLEPNETVNFQLYTGKSELCAAGGPSSEIFDYIDLCPRCAGFVLSNLSKHCIRQTIKLAEEFKVSTLIVIANRIRKIIEIKK